MLEFRILGTLTLQDSSGKAIRSVLAQPKRTALLAYLALGGSGGFLRRDKLLSVFWPESPEDRARNALNQAVFVLRRALGTETIVARGQDEVGVDTQQLWCDAVAFGQALDAENRVEALGHYGGDLLDGFFLSESLAFERWLEEERARLRERAVAAALATSQEHVDSGNPVEAVYWVRRATGWAPFDESIVRRLLTLLAGMGDRPGALREYEAYRGRLDAELSLEPSPDIREIVQSLHTLPRVGPAGAPDSVPPAGGSRETAPSRTPVGAGGPPIQPSSGPVEARVTGTPTGREAARRGRRRLTAGVIALGAALVVSAVLLLPRLTRSEHPPLDTQRVLVAPFDNRTGDPTLDPVGLMAGDWVAQGLARSGMVRVVPMSTLLHEQEGGHESTSGERGSLSLARDLGAGLVVTGGVYLRRDSLVLQSRILSSESGEVVRAVDEVSGPRSAPPEAVETLRHHLLGALATLTDPRLASWASPGDQPPGLESYRLLAAGFDRFFTADQRRQLGTDNSEPDRLNRQAAALFIDAAGPDSTFVMPLLWAVFARQNAGERAAADSLLAALEGRTDLSEWERAVLDLQIATARGDREEAFRRAKAIVELSPDSEWLYLLGLAAYDTQRYRAAIDAFERADPDRGWLRDLPSYWHLRVDTRHAMGDHEGELADVHELRARFPADRDVPRMEMVALAALGRSNALLSRVREALAERNRAVIGWLGWVAQESVAHGHEALAREVTSAGLGYFEASTGSSRDEEEEAARARILEAAGQWGAARSAWEKLAANAPETIEYRARLGVLAARRGDPIEASRIDQWLQQRDPSPSDPNGGPLVWRARIAAQLGQNEAAVALIQEALNRGWRHAPLMLHANHDFEPLRNYEPFSALLRARD